MTDKIVVLSACASSEEAARIARGLVEKRLAACVNVLPGVRSIYRWKGAIEDESEVLLVIKSSRALFNQLRIELERMHSYEVPEAIAIPVVEGSEPYLAWMERELASRVGLMTERPTHARYWVIFYAVTLAILSYINRVAISQAAPEIARDLKFTDVQMGKIFGAFALSYALFEVPSGWLGDWIGPRKVLLRIVLWWSAFTAITGAMWNFTSLWLARFFFGAGEAGGFPNLTKAFTTWLPKLEHVRAQGIMWTFARWGGAFTPVLVVWVLHFVNWRWAFVLFRRTGRDLGVLLLSLVPG